MTRDYLTITALTKYLKKKFDADPYLERVFLTGEISNFRLRATHQYFSLKDDGAKISATMFKGAFSKLKFQPEEGMKVFAIGRISLYEATGSYQIYLEHMEPDGVGALYQAYEQLKKQLAQEGLFISPKKELPRFPKRIAVLTSPSGAVIRDIITTVKRRYPIAEVVLFPTVVQGEKASADVVRNLARVQEVGNFDTVIVGRGGGSIEDLWPFNEERVARAIYNFPLPVISSVGHETDTTIADLVADVRAATPTAAAELAVPVLSEELLKIKTWQARLEQAFKKEIQSQRERFTRSKESYVFRQPVRLYEGQTIKLDRINQQMIQQLQQLLFDKERQQQQLLQRLVRNTPQTQLKQMMQQHAYLKERLTKQTRNVMESQWQKFTQTTQALDLLSPLKIMGRGYSYTTKEARVVKSITELAVGEQLAVFYPDGQATVQVMELKEEKHE